MAAARPFFEKAGVLDPKSHLPFFMLGNVASELGDLDTAVRHYARAREIHPNDHVIRYNLGLNQLWSGYIDDAIEELGAACRIAPTYLKAQSTYLMALHYSDRVTPDYIASATQQWGVQFATQHFATASSQSYSGRAVPDMLRVGFVSGDFRTHSVAHFIEPILTARAKSAFEYVLYSCSSQHDGVTDRLRVQADVWRDVSQMSDDALFDTIRTDRIDVLVDLAGHTDFNRLVIFARRAAPVQISYLGYPDSTGLPNMDFRVTDAITDPQPLADTWHTESLLRLPVPQWCFRPFGSDAAPGPLPARSAGVVTLGSFNNLTKVSDTLLRCWVQILVKSPTSRLRLTRVRSPKRATEILNLFRNAGVAAERIEFVSYRDEVPYGLQFAGADIALDAYPYNGVTTTCEALYFGLPVVSLHGRNGVSRSGLSLLTSLGLRELVASSMEEYVNISVGLISDLGRLETLRGSMRARFEQSPLRDETGFAGNFEEQLRVAWRQARSLKPDRDRNIIPPL